MEDMGPANFEEIVLTQCYRFYDLPNVQLNVEERITIRSCIQQCLKKKIPRENQTRPGVDKRRSGANEALAIYSGSGDATSPKEKLKFTSGKQGVTKITTEYNRTYHEAAKDLLLEKNVLTKEYEFDQSGWLSRNSQRLPHDEFLNFIRERLSLEGLKEFRCTKPLTKLPDKTDDCEKMNKTNAISLALKVVLGRTYSDMALEGDKQHREALAEFAIYTAILDAIYHKKYKTCGIENAGTLVTSPSCASIDNLNSSIEQMSFDDK